jgi:hypothetical protein
MATVTNSSTLGQEFRKEIKWNRATKDYDLFLDGEYVGSAANYSEGERRLNELVYAALTHQQAA